MSNISNNDNEILDKYLEELKKELNAVIETIKKISPKKLFTQILKITPANQALIIKIEKLNEIKKASESNFIKYLKLIILKSIFWCSIM